MTVCAQHGSAVAEAFACRFLLISLDEQEACDAGTLADRYGEIRYAGFQLGSDLNEAGACAACLCEVAVFLARWYATDCAADRREAVAQWLTDRIVAVQSRDSNDERTGA